MKWLLVVDPIRLMLALIWGVLFLATCIVYVLRAKQPQRDHTELVQRTQTWWLILILFTLALLAGRIASLCLIGFISFLALKEFFSMIPTRRADRSVLLWAYLTIPIQYYWVGINWYGMFIIFIPVYMFLLFPLRMQFGRETKGFIKAVGTIQWGVMLTVFAFSHLAYLLNLPPLKTMQVGGAGLFLYCLFLTEINDVNQYICGKLFGKHKIIPAISPNKTWEGFLGGIIITTLLAMIIHSWLTPFTTWEAVASGILISVTGFVGDINISAVKRDLNIKETGGSLPGHGGILDRIDSLLFTSMLFFHFTYYLYY